VPIIQPSLVPTKVASAIRNCRGTGPPAGSVGSTVTAAVTLRGGASEEGAASLIDSITALGLDNAGAVDAAAVDAAAVTAGAVNTGVAGLP